MPTRGNEAKARADFSSSIDANKTNGIAYYNRGNVHFDLRKLQHAAADYSKAIELEPDIARAFLNRALVNERLGAWGASISDYRAALARAENEVAAARKRAAIDEAGEAPRAMSRSTFRRKAM